MKLAWAIAILVLTGAAHADTPKQQIAAASACTPTPRLVFDPPGKRHSLPALTWDGAGYSVVGYDSMPTQLYLTRIDAKTKKLKSTKLTPGGVHDTATNGSQLALVYFAEARPGNQGNFADPSDDVPPRYQSYFAVVDRAGQVVVKAV